MCGVCVCVHIDVAEREGDASVCFLVVCVQSMYGMHVRMYAPSQYKRVTCHDVSLQFDSLAVCVCV